MKVIDDKIKFESRCEVQELLAALEAVPQELQTDFVKEFKNKLDYLEWMW